MPNRSRVFISYSHDSEQHVQFVLELAERLIEDGFNCVLDFSLDEAPTEGWRAWFEAELQAADFTLVICTPSYWERYQANSLLAPHTENFSGLVITEELYNTYVAQTKFVPILPEGGKLQAIIPPLQGQNAYELMTDYLGLHQLLKNRSVRSSKAEPQAVRWTDSTDSQAQSAPLSKPTRLSEETTRAHSSSGDNKQVIYLAVIGGLILVAALLFLLF